MKAQKIYDGTDPGGTPGRVFTASIGQETLINYGAELSYVKMGLRGTVGTAAVVIETFADLLSEWTLRVGPDFRIVADGQMLCALMHFYYKELPTIGENTDATGSDLLGGIKVPLYQKVDANRPFTHTATRTAQTNITVETLAITGYWDTGEKDRKPIHAIKIARTSAAATGYDELTSRIAPVGNMIGLILNQPNGFDDTNIDTSVQRMRIKANGVLHSQFNTLADMTPVATIDFVTPSPMADLLRPYILFDMRDSGIDTKSQIITIEQDVQDVSDALEYLPVIEVV